MTSPTEQGEALPGTSKMTTEADLHVSVLLIAPRVNGGVLNIDEIITDDFMGRPCLKLHLDIPLEDPRDLNGKVRARIGKRITDLLKQYERTHHPVQLGSEVQELASGREGDEPSPQGTDSGGG